MADSNPTTQSVDSRIVSLLGLQDDLELSHEDYFRALKEFAVAARMTDGKFSSEEVTLITEELKRVRKEDKNIKFQTEKKKVKAKPKNQKVSSKNNTKPKYTAPKANNKVTSLSTFVQNEPKSTVAEPQAPPQAKPTVPLLPQPKKKTVEVKEKKQKVKKEDCCEVIGKKLTKIDSTLGSIFSTLKDQFLLSKKDSERERRGREKAGRDDAENKLEKGSGIKEIVNVAKNLLSPFQDLFDRIKRFIVFTLLGKAFTMFMDWMKDPKNRQTFTTIVKFLTDHWVLIVGSYLLFGTRLGGLVRSVSKLVVKMAVKAVVATGRLIAVLAKSKWGRVALAAGAVTAGAVAISQSGKKKDDKQDVESYAKGGIIGGIGDALKFTPLGMAFEAGKFGAKALGSGAKVIGKSASGTADLLGKGLKNTLDVATLPLTVGFKGLAGASEFLQNGLKSLNIFKLLAGPIQDITKKGGDKDPKLQAAGGIPGLIGTIAQKTSEGVGKNVKDSKKSKTEKKDKGSGYAKGGFVNPLTAGLMGAVPGLGAFAPFAPLLLPLLQSKKIGGDHGIPVSGAGKDDRLLKVRTGDAILTEKDQKLLSSGKLLEKMGGPMGGLTSLFSGNGIGKETVVAAKKGEAVVTQEDQQNIFEKTGINIPSLLSGRKPNKISSDKLKTKSGVSGFSNGGIIEGYASGGIVGGTSVLDLGKKISGNSDYEVDPTLSKSIPLLYKMLQSGRFKEKGWGDKKFLDQLTARLLHESSNFSRAREMYDSDPRDPKGKEGYQYFSGYSGKLGNKNADDAYNFRGRGAIQLTGRTHYEAFNKWLKANGHKGIDVTKNPDLLANDPKVQALSTLYYLEDREKTFKVNFADMAKRGDSTAFTYNINGGYRGLEETQSNLRKIQGLSGGVNYGRGFAPATPKSKASPASTNPIMNIASRAMSAIGNVFSPPAQASERKAKSTPNPAAPKPKRWAIDPRGWVGKKGGGIVSKNQGRTIGDQLRMLRGMRADSLERQGNPLDAYGLRSFNIQDSYKKFATNDIFSKNRFSLSDYYKNYFDIKKKENKNKIFSNIPRIKSNYKFNQIKNNTSLAFNPKVNLNPQQPKKQSIADTLKELREMRARSLDRQGDTLGSLGVRASNYNLPKIGTNKLNTLKVDPKKAYGNNLNIITPQTKDLPTFDFSKVTSNTASFKPSTPSESSSPTPSTPPAATPEVQKKAGGGLINKIGSGIKGLFQGNRKRDIAKKAASKTTTKGNTIRDVVSNISGKKSPYEKKKKGFWGGIYDTVSGINSGITTAKDIIKRTPKHLTNIAKSAASSIAKNPKMLKIGGAFSKFGGRMVPGLGVAASAADAAARAEKGDTFGATLSGLGAASGATTIATSGASLTGVGAAIPAISEAVSMGADVTLLGKDIFDIVTSRDSANPKSSGNSIKKGKMISTLAGMKGGGIVKLEGGGDWREHLQNSLNHALSVNTAKIPGEIVLRNMMATHPANLQKATPSISNESFADYMAPPINKFQSGMQSLGERARNVFSPITNLFSNKQNQPPVSSPSPSKNLSSFFAKGSVMENTGINMSGGTADRQLTALQPGEYVIPKKTVNAFGGVSFFDDMVAKTDSNSNPAKLGSKSKPNIGGGIKPYSINNSKKPQVTNLGSAKEARSGAQLSQGSTPNGSSKEVFFDALCQEGHAPSERQRIMDLLGVHS
jgi:predicted chitinase